MSAFVDGLVTGLLIAGIIAANAVLIRLVVRDYRAVLRKERDDIRNNHRTTTVIEHAEGVMEIRSGSPLTQAEAEQIKAEWLAAHGRKR